MDKRIYLSMVAAFATAGITTLLALLAAPIWEPLAWAVIIGVATIPYYNRLLGRFPDRPGRCAGIMVFIVTICFIIPIAGLVAAIAHSAPGWIQQAEGMASSMSAGPAFLHRIPFVDHLASMIERAGIDIGSYAAKYAEPVSGWILETAGNMAKGLAELLFVLAVALFILFFIYRDGERVVCATTAKLGPNREAVCRYLYRIRATTTAVVVGTLFTCLVQGITAGLGYLFAGVPAPILFGSLTAIAALVPVVGTGVIWVPLVLLTVLKGAYLKAALLATWCMFMVGLADNAIRPLAVGAKGDVPVPAVVLGAICGVTSLGLLGLILGPILFAATISLWHELAKEQPPAVGAKNPN